MIETTKSEEMAKAIVKCFRVLKHLNAGEQVLVFAACSTIAQNEAFNQTHQLHQGFPAREPDRQDNYTIGTDREK